MNWKEEYKKLLWIAAVFILAYFLPVDKERFTNAIIESFTLAKWYAREHVLLCLVPAFFIAGVISVFVSQAAVIKYLGGQAKKWGPGNLHGTAHDALDPASSAQFQGQQTGLLVHVDLPGPVRGLPIRGIHRQR